jgi:hypothetical protein
MAIKYIVLEDQRKVYGVMENTRYDAVNKINRIVGSCNSVFTVHNKKYEMPNTFKACCVCDEADTFSVEEGKNKVKKKILDRYYKSFDKRIAMFRSDLIQLNSKAFETPSEIQ